MDNAQQALFRAMLNNGWFTSSDGNVESPFGYFGYMTNKPNELKEIFDAFDDVVSVYNRPPDTAMVGSWFASINSDGIISIDFFHSALAAKFHYQSTVEAYGRWLDDVIDADLNS